MKDRFFIVLLLLATSFASCKKDDESVPALPAINDINLSLVDSLALNSEISIDDTLRNSLSLTVTLPNNTNIAKVQLYVDAKLVNEDRQSPFEFNWNTLDEEDGTHSLKVVVEDKQGKSIEKISEVYVENTLLKIALKTWISEGLSGYVVVSGDDGDVLYSQKLSNNTIYSVKSNKPYYGKTVNLSFAYKARVYVSVSSYIKIKRGITWQAGYTVDSTPEDQEKTAVLSFKNNPELSTVKIISPIYSNTFKDKPVGYNWYSQFNYYDESQVMIEIDRPGGKFYDLFSIEGDTIEVDLSAISKQYTTKIFDVPSGTSVFHFMSGIKNNFDYMFGNGDITPENGKLVIPYPSIGFDKYSALITATDNIKNKEYSNNSFGKFPNSFRVLEVDAQIKTNTLRNFSVDLMGTFDYYSSRNRCFPNSKSYHWNTYVPSHVKEYKLPEINKLIETDDFTQANFTMYAFDMFDIPNYEDNGQYFKLYSAEVSDEVVYESEASVTWRFDQSNQRKFETSRKGDRVPHKPPFLGNQH
jgi:hypothetical protein